MQQQLQLTTEQGDGMLGDEPTVAKAALVPIAFPDPFVDDEDEPNGYAPSLDAVHPRHAHVTASCDDVGRSGAFSGVASLFMLLTDVIGDDRTDPQTLDFAQALWMHGEGYRKAALDGRVLSERSDGNQFVTILPEVDTEPSPFVLTAHLDTVSRGARRPVRELYWGSAEKENRTTRPMGYPTDLWCRTDGSTILGADDRAGLAVIVALIAEGVPGRYALFTAEEGGGTGSADAAFDLEAGKGPLVGARMIVSLDRHHCNSVITHQWGKTASTTFAVALGAALNAHMGFVDARGHADPLAFATGLYWRPDDGGTFTDSASFSALVPECSNLSVGYVSQHTTSERQNLTHLERLARALKAMALAGELDALPVERELVDHCASFSYTRTTYTSGYSRRTFRDRYLDDQWDDVDGYDDPAGYRGKPVRAEHLFLRSDDYDREATDTLEEVLLHMGLEAEEGDPDVLRMIAECLDMGASPYKMPLKVKDQLTRRIQSALARFPYTFLSTLGHGNVLDDCLALAETK